MQCYQEDIGNHHFSPYTEEPSHYNQRLWNDVSYSWSPLLQQSMRKERVIEKISQHILVLRNANFTFFSQAKYNALQEKRKDGLLPTTVIRDSTTSMMNGNAENSHSNLLLSQLSNVPNGLISPASQIIGTRTASYT